MPKLQINDDLCDVYNQTDIKDHAKKKSMWGGSFKPGPHDDFIYNEEKKSFEYKTITYADSLYKNFDEVLVNVVDIHIKQKLAIKKYRVGQCIIDFNKDGYIKILNTGQGMPVDIVKDLKGNPVYVPQLISTEFLAGSNNADDENRVTGGVNGIGLSMVFNNSVHTILETVDIDRKKYYIQETFDRLSIINEPTVSSMRGVSDINPIKRGGTCIKFKPVYDAYNFDINNDYTDLNSLFKARAIQVAAHTGIDVIYNNVNVLPGKNKIPTFASMFMKKFVHINIKHEKYPWDIVIGISNTDKFQSLSIVNGVYVKTGNHINYIRDLVIDGIKTRAEKLVKKYREYKKSMLQNHMFVIMSGNIPNPDFDSQTKTNISGGTSKYKSYTIKASDLTNIWKMLEPVLISEYMENPADKKKVKKISTTGIKKYKAAKFAGKKPCKLLVCEGDSAESMTRTALVSKDTDLNYDYCGTFNIGGVPINARTKSTPYKKLDGTIAYKREKMLVDNERWSSFEKVMNLDHSCTYISDTEFKTLSYTEIIMTVDQDLDGVGQICGLMISNIHRFWPVLIQRGIVKQFETPIKRAYPKSRGDVISFYTDQEHRIWEQKTFGNTEPNYDIKYYKGLATHNDDEAVHMFKCFDDHLYTFTLDDAANSTFEIYYGKDPDLRKEELVKPLESKDDMLNMEDIKPMEIPSSIHLKSHTKEFQLDNIMRKLPNVYDGLNPARRKALCGARKRFKHNNKEVKIFQLAGYIAEHMNYHHGGASLESTLINMAQNYVGANNFPLLLPLSQFGSRYRGGKDAGAPRYIKTKLNNELVSTLFRSDDDYVIKYTSDEGEINEPVNYVPIAPFVLMESLELPASGWKYCGYSRSWDSIYKNITNLIEFINDSGTINISLIKPMPFEGTNWNGDVRSVRSKSGIKQWSVGSYTYDNKTNTVEISELPYQTWNSSFEDNMEKKTHVLNIDDKSSKLHINIKVKLRPDSFAKIESECKGEFNEFDVIEDYLGLKSCMNQNLNMMKDGSVKEYNSYETVLYDWFNVRYATYKKRFDRLVIIIRLRIEMLKQVIKFVENRKKYNFSDISEEESNSIVKKDAYIKFNKTLLDNPRFTPIDHIERLVKGDNAPHASYDYLYSISPKQQMQAARDARDKKLKALEDQFKHITSDNIIKFTWLSELKELDLVIRKSRSSDRGWLYGESKSKLI
jgi:DNA gyrase/topoisomerase IV subunit B